MPTPNADDPLRTTDHAPAPHPAMSAETVTHASRPALRRLMADIEAGTVDCVVVHKVDRLSRSLLGFARLMETFEKRRVSFVSVTRQFNTAMSRGRLVRCLGGRNESAGGTAGCGPNSVLSVPDVSC